MSAIDALTSTNNVSATNALLNATSKKNKDIDFNQIMAAAMQPSLPGTDSAGGGSSGPQYMLQVSMIEQMQALAAKLDKLANSLPTNDTTAAEPDTTSSTKGV